ncbi:MAG: LysR family transcriptional regulator [Pseudomonadota bacterium]
MTPDHRHIRTDLSLNQIDLNLLRVFDVLMHERSVTRTAERIGRTQSAVSHSVARLRSIFNDELFVREGSAMIPTPKALGLAAVISMALADIGTVLDQNAHFDPRNSTRNFRIGLTDYAAVTFLPRLIERFSREAPNATLNILHARESEVTEQLRSKEVECLVLGNPSKVDAHLSKVVISTDKMVCAGWRGNPQMAGLTVEQYLAADHLQISSDGVAEGLVDIELRKMNLSRKVVATIPHYLVAPWVIKGTSLITVFGASVLLALTDASETVILEPPIPLPDLVLTMVHERYREADLGHAWLRKLLRDIAEEQRMDKARLYRDFS